MLESGVYAAILDGPLSADTCIEAVRDPSCGAVVIFLGVVRNHDHGVGVAALSYSAHPDATDALVRTGEKVRARHHDVRLATQHRVGDLEIGDTAVVVAASSPHRPDAFAAARDLIDTLKAEVPIWKEQRHTDGSTEWVGLP